ncbi:sulfotransferase [Bradyrhizobium sp. KB893862 SZCCT0404]|uniref:sulfotransferase family protein n=1 Tax=Bradyrhizobium sp. KB893862 SZCCT0404 TaxID=2807672 RepID=UPI001BAC5E79|nr:sulfotransferase [Bradyrhizobium sp. KB893862 SZCCT0404]MBR1177224.1 sulfotransferase [Bradyrhizobium sp. KB893862 SZCCT0404]
MQGDIHFISGLPRAGSTLLSAILRQNPRFRAGMTGPVGSLVDGMLRSMSMSNETAIFISDEQRRELIKAIFSTYYADLPKGHVVFDTNRNWCARLPLVTELFPRAKVICCVRHIPWILDSVERLIRRNKYQPSGIFNFDPSGTVYSRVDGMAGPNGMVGFAWNALREAFCGEQSACLLALTYETLTTQPERAIAAVYEFIGEKPFAHDFQNIEFDAEEFDRRIGTPGLHKVGRRVESPGRKTVLPGDLWRKYENDAFWGDPARNPNQVRVV